ncbi:hyaluronan mediated motility receptor isoform X2 [Ambystoma mexicanum]|uniref:hyaluronan mediated motility receptor isoform X2 n=1 Tax=Ambystoma mexicanum TaxID=8296 RepID=UPI0037E93BF1
MQQTEKGCAPAPGSYDVKDCDIKGATSFTKAQRFQKSKGDGPGSTQSLESDRGAMSPVRSRKLVSLGSTPNLSRKSDKDSDFIRELQKQKHLEKEIRSLVKERGEQDKRLLDLEDEFKKTEAKLTSAIREKSSLSAIIASLERQLADLHKANELMKSKFSDDGLKKKLSNLSTELMETKHKLDNKDQELMSRQTQFEGQIKMLKADLETSKSTLQALQEKNKYLECVHQEGKLQSEEVELEMDKLHTLIKELRGENKTLHAYLAEAQEQIQDIRMQMRNEEVKFQNALKLAKSNMEEQSQVLAEKLAAMELRLEDARSELKAALERESHLEEKIVVIEQSKEKLIEEQAETEKKLLENMAEISQLSEQVRQYKSDLAHSEELLKEKDQDSLTKQNIFLVKEAELDRQIKELDDRCHSLQQEKESFATESQEREQAVHAEVSLLKKRLLQEEQGNQMLQQKQDKLLFALKQAEELTTSLRQELLQVEEEMRTEKSLLEDELEGTLDELDRLQLEEQHAEMLIAHLEQENKLRAEELNRLENTLKEKNTELEKVHLANRQAAAQLEGRQTALCKLKEVTAELESYKLLMSSEVDGLKTQNSCLLAKVAEMDTSVLDKARQLQEIQHSTARAEEEFARMVLDAQTRLAMKEAEMKQSEDVLNKEITELKDQVEKQKYALHEQCQEVERLRGESVDEKVLVELKGETQKWRTLFEELHNKVKPFQEQLDMFEAEKNALLNEHGAAQEELNKLSDNYAKLLGHQNQRQKIKHVMKLKEENIQLKQEVARLRCQLSKTVMQGGKRLDLSKSFQAESKENVVPKTPLKEGNRKVMV